MLWAAGEWKTAMETEAGEGMVAALMVRTEEEAERVCCWRSCAKGMRGVERDQGMGGEPGEVRGVWNGRAGRG